MTRTPEQTKADEALREAIIEVQRAYGAEMDFLLVDYLVLTAETKFDDEGDPVTAYSTLYPDGTSTGGYKALGLIEVHRRLIWQKMEDVE